MKGPTMSSPDRSTSRVVVIGAGPAGLTAARELTKVGREPVVVEKGAIVGGLACTASYKGYRFDMGGHRFFTKVDEVKKMWQEVLGSEFLRRPRLSRIFYRGRFFYYPLKPLNALLGLGLWSAVLVVLSYVRWQLFPHRREDTFEQWVTNRFGKRLFSIFFKTYTEKVWGMSCKEISADWAAQRIKNLSLFTAIKNAVMPKRNQKDVTSLIEEFQYPKFGPGMMWETAADKIRAQGGSIVLEEKVKTVHHANGRATGVTTVVTGGYGPGAGAKESTRTDIGSEVHYDADEVISTMAFSSLIRAMDPPPPADVLAAANGLKFRDFLTVALVVPESAGFPDNWIYIHSPEVKVGRIQNFGSWSPYLVKEGRTCLGLEYFVYEGDETWSLPDDELIALAKKELAYLGLVQADQVERGFVVRMPKAYPYYDLAYKRNVETMRRWLDQNAPNVHPVGRNGMFRYNNQDHSMFTALLTVENITEGAHHDVWEVNVEDDYHEEVAPGSVTSLADVRKADKVH
jgi:protoporphyrinogen oxidase